MQLPFIAAIYRASAADVKGPRTVLAQIDIGFGVVLTRAFPLFNLGGPEPASVYVSELQAATQAQLVLQDLIQDKELYVTSYHLAPDQYAVSLFYPTEDPRTPFVNVETMLVKSGVAYWNDPLIPLPSLEAT